MATISNVKEQEERDFVVALIVKDGLVSGISGKAPGYLIHKLETVLAEINEYQIKRDEKLSESNGD